jgi:hypothetical protein
VLPNSEKDEDIGDEKYEEGAHTDEPTVYSDHELYFVGVCTGQSEKLREVTVKAVQCIWATEG